MSMVLNEPKFQVNKISKKTKKIESIMYNESMLSILYQKYANQGVTWSPTMFMNPQWKTIKFRPAKFKSCGKW